MILRRLRIVREKIFKLVKRIMPSRGPSSDGSNSSSKSEPNQSPKILPKSNKRPLSKSNLTEPATKSYHFNLKVKLETVPQWDRNTDILARWLNKINRLTEGSSDIHWELRKIFLQMFTSSAKT